MSYLNYIEKERGTCTNEFFEDCKIARVRMILYAKKYFETKFLKRLVQPSDSCKTRNLLTIRSSLFRLILVQIHPKAGVIGCVFVCFFCIILQLV